jgi:GT2 family glycosyltransferase
MNSTLRNLAGSAISPETMIVPTVSVIVPVHSWGEPFEGCLKQLLVTQPAPEEIILVLDGITFDNQISISKRPGTHILVINRRSGPAAARNLGGRQATGDILVFIDSDVFVPDGFVMQFKTLFRENPDISAVIGSYDDAPGDPGFFSQYRNLFHHFTHQQSSPQAATFFGACGAIRRDVFMGMKGFDESILIPAMEDIDLGYRLKKQGRQIRLEKGIQVKHMKKWTFLTMVKTDFFQRALPWTRLLLTHHRFDNDLNLKISSRVSVALVFLWCLSLPVLWVWPGAGWGTLVFSLLLLGINGPVHGFYFKKRGILFAVASVPLLWFYYFYSGLAFIIETLRYYSNPHHWAKIKDKSL